MTKSKRRSQIINEDITSKKSREPLKYILENWCFREFKHELNNESSSSSVAEEAMEVAVDYKNEDDEDFPMDEDETTQIQRIINYSSRF